ncbi:MAG: aldehyde dehydrogenase family protein [Phycisphaerae bacterium]|nr:aldehyde dehydrogenase family protein [Phycisphaerae bacterium]
MSEAVRRGFLRQAPADFIGGSWHTLPAAGEEMICSADPSQPTTIVWNAAPVRAHIDRAVAAARSAGRAWACTAAQERHAALLRWRDVVVANESRIADLLVLEVGKTRGEALLEAKALAEKVTITVEERTLDRVRGFGVDLSPTRRGVCAFRPHGVMAVFGPFNFPAHLPNGHFVPALLLGNTVVLKPSERTPAVGQLLAELADAAGFPPGVFNVVQACAGGAAALAAHEHIDGILFTGSWPVGRRILQANLDRPGRIVALEMGGSNPAIVLDDCHLKQAVVECVRSAFATAGQRCTCTRRVIVQRGVADAFMHLLVEVASRLRVGGGDEAGVFMGPLIREAAREAVVAFQSRRVREGCVSLLAARAPAREGWFLTPGVLRVDRFSAEADEEVFGPLLQVAVVDSDDEAVEQANATRFGLAAAVFTADAARWQAISPRLRAGCVNWNVGTAGASSRLPFGGLGLSGNHRPAAAFGVDSCAFPVAHLEERTDAAPLPPGMDPF